MLNFVTKNVKKQELYISFLAFKQQDKLFDVINEI